MALEKHGDSPFPAARVQAFLLASAERQYDPVSVPPFRLFFHPADPLPYFNYAVPERTVDGNLTEPLAALRGEFRKRNRIPRFEFVEESAPGLAGILAAAGFIEEARPVLMACLPAALRTAPRVGGLEVTVLTPLSSLPEIKRFLLVQRLGFGFRQSPSDEDARWFRGSLGDGRALLGTLGGDPAGTAMFTHPGDGLTEVVGVATIPALRRRGVGTALTAEAVHTAFDLGLEAVILSAADERAGRIYESVGFRRFGTVAAWKEGATSSPRPG
jgi:ribosomal protein S18 acetylase RimI-like enzyme